MPYGATHECNPESEKTKPCVINSVINSDESSSKEIDSKTCQLLNEGKEIVTDKIKRNYSVSSNSSYSSFLLPGLIGTYMIDMNL